VSARPPLLVATCGLAFSGKSTLARRVAEPLAAELVSLDALNAERGFDGGSVIDDSEWERTSWMAVDRVAAVLGQGRSAVVDDTFSHRFLRDRFRACAHKAGARFAILFIDTPLAIIEARIAANALTRARPGIEPEVFAHHRARFQFPSSEAEVVRIAEPGDLDCWLAAELATT